MVSSLLPQPDRPWREGGPAAERAAPPSVGRPSVQEWTWVSTVPARQPVAPRMLVTAESGPRWNVKPGARRGVLILVVPRAPRSPLQGGRRGLFLSAPRAWAAARTGTRTYVPRLRRLGLPTGRSIPPRWRG